MPGAQKKFNAYPEISKWNVSYALLTDQSDAGDSALTG
jgi:hypothetical protein